MFGIRTLVEFFGWDEETIGKILSLDLEGYTFHFQLIAKKGKAQVILAETGDLSFGEPLDCYIKNDDLVITVT